VPDNRSDTAGESGGQVRPRKEIDMTRFRRLILAVVVGVLVTLPTAGSAFAGIVATALD
jgi:hypothetical protein